MLEIRASLASLGCVVVLVACSPDSDEDPAEAFDDRLQAGDTTSSSARAGTVTNEDAVNDIVSALCAREVDCRHVGPNKRYPNRETCVAMVRDDLKGELSAKECPRGIARAALNECLEAIRKEDCTDPLEAIGGLAACRTDELCLEIDTPTS
jgi:Family of unknown function (DUF6184)